jgi:Dna[CI] antecedent, DciA
MGKTRLPHRHLKDLLPSFLDRVESRCKERPDLVLKGWQEVADPRWRQMTEAISFAKGVVVINVKNGALYSVLVTTEAARLLKKMQEKFPEKGIRYLKFCVGD